MKMRLPFIALLQAAIGASMNDARIAAAYNRSGGYRKNKTTPLNPERRALNRANAAKQLRRIVRVKGVYRSCEIPPEVRAQQLETSASPVMPTAALIGALGRPN